MGLQIETFRDLGGKRDRQLPVAEYVPERWKQWLQTQRVELNAMTSPEFVRWLDMKFETYADKVVPPQKVLRDQLDEKTHQELKRLIAADILAAGGFETRVKDALASAREKMQELDLDQIVRAGLDNAPEQRWDRPLDTTAVDVAAGAIRA